MERARTRGRKLNLVRRKTSAYALTDHCAVWFLESDARKGSRDHQQHQTDGHHSIVMILAASSVGTGDNRFLHWTVRGLRITQNQLTMDRSITVA
ncbi:hypothetical protein Mapa_011497 [Marchantia paleacea]|nr:hypothetical protein Mapa_011497 [Marchantia paleacea]